MNSETTSGQPDQECQMTRRELQDLLEKSDYGEKAMIFKCYFMADVMPPRCAACGKMIAEHGDGQPKAVALAASPTAAIAAPTDETKLVLSRPDGLVQNPTNPNLEVVDRPLTTCPIVGHMISLVVSSLLLIGCAVCCVLWPYFFTFLMVFTCGVPCIAPFTIWAVIALGTMKTYTLTFNRTTKQVHHEVKYWLWCCGCDTDSYYDFDTLLHVEQLDNGLQCRVRGTEEKIHLSGLIADEQRLAWTKFLDSLRPPPPETATAAIAIETEAQPVQPM